MNKSRSKKIRLSLIALFLLILLPLIAILIAVQPFFIRAVVFPRIETATDISIEVDTFSLSPFSKLTAEGGRIRKRDGEFDLEFDSLLLRYDLIRILKGNLEVDQLRLVRPVLQLRMDAEEETESGPATDKAGEESDLRIHLRDLEIVEGRVILLLPEARVELADLQLQIPEIQNGGRIQPRFETSLRIMEAHQPDQPQVAGTISTEIDLQLSDNLQPTSFTGGFQARVQHEELEGRDLRVEFQSDLRMDLENMTFHVRSLTGEAQLGDQQILELQLLAPMEVDASAVPPQFTDTELHLVLGTFNLRDIPFSEFLPIQEANVGLECRLKISESGHRILATAQFAARDMEGQFQGVDLSAWDVEGGFDLNGTADKLTWEEARIVATHKKEPFLDLTSSGNTLISLEEGDLSLRVAAIPVGVVADLFPELPMQAGKVSGTIRIRWSPGPEYTFRLDMEGTELILDEDKALPSPLNLDLVAAATPETLLLRTARIAWPVTKGYGNELSLSGTVDWEDVAAVETHLKITADSLDVKPWYFPPGGKESVSPSSPVIASVPEEVKLQPLPLKPSTLSLQVARVRLDEIQIRDVVVEVEAERQRIEFKPVNFKLNESDFTSQARFDWSEALAAYQLQAEMTPLTIQPIADSLLPEKKGALTGVIQGRVQMSGKGSTWSTMRENVRGELDVSLTEGRIRLLDPNPEQNTGLMHTRKVVRQILTVLARALDLPSEQLMAPPLDQVVLRSRIEPGRMEVEKFETLNTEFYLEAHGRIALAEIMEASRFEAFPVVIGLNTNLAKRARIYREDRVKEGRVLLPSFLSVGGTLSEAEVTVNRSVITGLILTGVTERNDIGNERVQGILEGLGGILSGEGPPPKPTPTPPSVPAEGQAPPPPVRTPTPSKTDQVLEGIRLFRELRATPMPTPNP